MKNSILSISGLLFAFLFLLNINAAGSSRIEFDSLSCLQIEGTVLNVEEGIESECTVELVSDNEVQKTLVLKEGKHKFKFVLSKNTFYGIRITKKGFASKLISVNTEMLTENDGIHIFKFETTLMNEAVAGKLNQDIIDFPVTIIQYDYEADSFVHNAEYTAYIKKELYKSTPVKFQKNKPVLYRLDTTDLACATK